MIFVVYQKTGALSRVVQCCQRLMEHVPCLMRSTICSPLIHRLIRRSQLRAGTTPRIARHNNNCNVLSGPVGPILGFISEPVVNIFGLCTTMFPQKSGFRQRGCPPMG